MSLDNNKKRELKAQAHHLKVIIQVGQHGVSESLIAETNNALNIHELIKVQIQSDDRDERAKAAALLGQQTQAELIHKIGKTFVFYRKKKEDKQT
ncbi:ribosome assembly RNA-binding protein YhbY [Ghiorsea bivora]|uniref:ribosome assembly RNA-binding protein YhbY n=1 Tax=Ghiorsea bivora TaxID=1485545 RepID=UPI00056FEE8C|nr:ribosome assembly RNA-binding protein YhbY [Ghiorsea bivora]